MLRHLSLYIALCLVMAARGQTALDELDLSGLSQPIQAKALRYWFDDDSGSIRTLNQLSGRQTLDVTELIEGLHTLHYQVIDSEDGVGYVRSTVFLKTGHNTAATVQSLRYWFDDDGSNAKTVTSTGIQTIDVSSLLDGLHTIHYQVTGGDGVAAYVASGLFLKMGSNPEAEELKASKLMYWFDDETAIQNMDVCQGVQMLDASHLTEGLHTIHYQVLCSNGQMTPAMSSIFLRLSIDSGTVVAKSLRYWFDDMQTTEEVEITDGVQLLDASNLMEGLHTVHYQIANSNGTLGAPYSSFFLMMNWDDAAMTAKSLRYWFDDETAVTETAVSNGTQVLKVIDLTAGLHTLNYQLIDNNGRVSVPVTRLFFKNFDKAMADDHNHVTKYQYWLNTNSQAMQTVELGNVSNPYTLIALLPMHKEPIQSSQFHFEVTNDAPTVYAKNTIHVRFYDAQNYFTDNQRTFVDYSVKQEVHPVGELQPSQTFDKVAENDVRWYAMHAEPGDTVAFKLSQPATIQVFSPSGEEVFKTSESASVNWGGIHTWEDGTYYLAVHDVTGSQSAMTLDYINIGKYAVLSHSPEDMGVMSGNFYIQLYGNGYDKLKKALLQNNSNILVAEVIQTKNISNATLQFSFPDNNYPRGNYDLVLEFADEGEMEKVIVEDALTIADPIFGDIAVEVVSRPAVAKPYPVTIKIRNTGNVTYQFVPLYFANSINKLESVELLNFRIESSKAVIDAGARTFYKVEKLFGEDSCIVVPTIIPVLNPYQNLEFQMGFVTGPHANFNMYAWTETPWSMRNIDIPETNRKRLGAPPTTHPTTNITCEMDPCELPIASNCVCNILWGNISAIANSFGAMNQRRNNILYDEYGDDYEALGMEWPYGTIPVKSPEDILEQALRGCVGELTPEELSQLQDAMEGVMDMMQERNQNGCPPPPPHPVDPYMPGDPNDIYGYTSTSGSKFVAENVVNVYYDIEFENDTTIANAAAHHIIVKDTLDARYFDLATFAPTSIRLGSQKIALDGEQNFLKTIDLRPSINAIAQIQLTYDDKKGIATWDFLSLDPMTMEPTDDVMQGILPVNYNGISGIGEASFDISLRPGLSDATRINNRASIVFDYEDAILTPTWTNIVDAVPPTSKVEYTSAEKADTVTLHFTGEDARSGIWRYTVYVQDGKNAPWREVGVTDSCAFDFEYAEGIDYGFCVLATDSAGNVEQKELVREAELRNFIAGDANSDGVVDTKDAVLVISYYLGLPGAYLNMSAADIVEDGVIDTKDAVAIIDKYLNTSTAPKEFKNRKRIRVL